MNNEDDRKNEDNLKNKDDFSASSPPHKENLPISPVKKDFLMHNRHSPDNLQICTGQSPNIKHVENFLDYCDKLLAELGCEKNKLMIYRDILKVHSSSLFSNLLNTGWENTTQPNLYNSQQQGYHLCQKVDIFLVKISLVMNYHNYVLPVCSIPGTS